MANFKSTEVIELEPKHPNSIETYTINLASSDGTNDGSSSDTGFLQGATISSVAWTTPSGITLDSSSNTTTALSMTVSGGTNGDQYDFKAVVTLSDSDAPALVIRVPVRIPV